MDSRKGKFRATCIKLGAFATAMILVFIGLVAVFSKFQTLVPIAMRRSSPARRRSSPVRR